MQMKMISQTTTYEMHDGDNFEPFTVEHDHMQNVWNVLEYLGYHRATCKTQKEALAYVQGKFDLLGGITIVPRFKKRTAREMPGNDYYDVWINSEKTDLFVQISHGYSGGGEFGDVSLFNEKEYSQVGDKPDGYRVHNVQDTQDNLYRMRLVIMKDMGNISEQLFEQEFYPHKHID